MRSRRIATKKAASKDRKESEESEFAYRETIPVNPQEVSARVLNALDHLGNQRFGMPPFSEHFRRWILDVESVLNDFKSSLPDATDASFNTSVTEFVSNIRSELSRRMTAEEDLSTKVAELLKQLSDNERELAALENEQRTHLNEARRAGEKSMKKLRGEIDALDAQRLKLLRQKPRFLQRLFGNTKTKVETSARTLYSKQSDLLGREANLKQSIDVLRSKYGERRKPLIERQAELRNELANLRSTAVDDALELRKSACEQIRQAVSTVLAQFAPQNHPGGQ
jgi:predicted  nucleic acid-binding Zn-ribbon protein